MPDKSLGQHWLHDRLTLEAIADCAEIDSDDTVLEIGPGLGTLTSVLLSQAKRVIAVEFDEQLAAKLPGQFPGKDLTVHHADVLSFDLNQLPKDYKVVANVPYYITSKIIQLLSEASNPPSCSVLLVQKEVAERLAARPGDTSILSIAAQVYHEVSLGDVVLAKMFTPSPQVDSQTVVMKRRQKPLVAPADEAKFFTVVKAGFSERRKKLRSSLSGGLRIDKKQVDDLLLKADISPEARAQELTIDDWIRLQRVLPDLV